MQNIVLNPPRRSSYNPSSTKKKVMHAAAAVGSYYANGILADKLHASVGVPLGLPSPVTTTGKLSTIALHAGVAYVLFMATKKFSREYAKAVAVGGAASVLKQSYELFAPTVSTTKGYLGDDYTPYSDSPLMGQYA